MKICIFGAGAIGGYLGVRLAHAGVDVSLVARGPHLEAIRRAGLRLRSGGAEIVARIPASDRAAEFGPQDAVIVSLKAHSAVQAVEALPALFHARTAVVTAVNGVPWWYFYQLPGPYADHRIQSVDPGDRQWTVIGPERAIGCVVYPSCEVVAPGIIEHLEGDRFTLGEPSGAKTERVLALAKVLRDAGFKAPVRDRIRDEIWLKLWGNLSFNPISALTGATLDVICATVETRAVARAMMVEAQAIGSRLDVQFPVGVDQRIAGAAAVGAHKTSMLQDLERGRTMEIDALVGAVQELGRLVEVPTPTIDTVLALVKLRARVAG